MQFEQSDWLLEVSKSHDTSSQVMEQNLFIGQLFLRLLATVRYNLNQRNLLYLEPLHTLGHYSPGPLVLVSNSSINIQPRALIE